MARALVLLGVVLALIRTDLDAQNTSRPGLGGTNHDLYESLCARPDMHKCVSFRDDTALNTDDRAGGLLSNASARHHASYDPHNDTHPHRQDAAKLIARAWLNSIEQDVPGANTEATARKLAADIDADDTQITMTYADRAIVTGYGIKIDDEIMVCLDPCRSGNTLNVLRGTYGTTATAHTAGAHIYRGINKHSANKLIFPLNMDDQTATYFLTWDVLYTDDMLGLSTPGSTAPVHGNTSVPSVPMTHYKGFRLLTGNSITMEMDLDFTGGATVTGASPACCRASDWNSRTKIATDGYNRWDGSVLAPVSQGTYTIGPPTPVVNVARSFEPNTWIRYFMLIEQIKDVDNLNETFTTLNLPIDHDDTTIVIDTPRSQFPTGQAAGGSFGNRVTNGTSNYVGRLVKIGSEIISLTSCPTTGATRTCTVLRGTNGTTAERHAAGSNILSSYDKVTYWIATESYAATKVLNRFPLVFPTLGNNPSRRNRITHFEVTMDTSTGGMVQKRYLQNFAEWTLYLKDFAMLKNPADCSASDCATLLVQPTARGQ
jgi:hypothetical protein